MKASTLLRGGVALAAAALLLSGCARLKRAVKKQAPAEIRESSYALALQAYEQSVTVGAAPEAVLSHLSDPESFPPVGMVITGPGEAAGEEAAGMMGKSYPARIGLPGCKAPARLIVVKSDNEKFWTVTDSPCGYMSSRFQYNRTAKGGRLHLRFLYQAPAEGTGPEASEGKGFKAFPLDDLDLALATVQARFQTGIDPRELVRHGLRGQTYETMLQVFETGAWIDAPPREIIEWMLVPENAKTMLKEFKLEDEYLAQYRDAPPGAVLYFPSEFSYGLLRSGTDVFFVKEEKRIRMYMVIFGLIIRTDFLFEPRAGGTDFTMRMAGEMPGMAGDNNMDLMLFITGMPRIMRERISRLKAEIETPVGPAARR